MHQYANFHVSYNLSNWLILNVLFQSMEVGQLGTTGKIVTLHVALVGRFVSVTATILHRRTMVKTAAKTKLNIKRVASTAVVRVFIFS